MVSATYGPAQAALPALRASPYGGGTSNTNLFVGNLPPHIREPELNEMFSACGTIVSSRVMVDQSTGRSRGSALVKFSSSDEAMVAIKTLNGEAGILVKLAERDMGQGPPRHAVAGRTHPSRVAADAAPAGPAAGGAGGAPLPLVVRYAGSDRVPSDNLYITGLPSPQADQGLLGELFAGLRLTVVRSRVIPDTKGTGSSAAMVQLASQEEAEAAISALHGQVVEGLSPGGGAAGRGLAARPGPGECTAPRALALKYAGGDGSAPSDNLYITGLPSPQVDQAALNQVFVGLGLTVVRSRVIPDTRGSGASAAMVQLASREQAESAILALHGEPLPALEAAGSGPVSPGGGSGGTALRVKYAGGDGGQPSDNLYISGLPSPPPDQVTLHRVFADLGLTVVRSRTIPDTRGAGTSAAMVQLASVEEASSAILALNGEPFPAAEPLPPAGAKGAKVCAGQWGGGGTMLRLKYAGGESSQPSDNLYITGLPSPPPDQATLNLVFVGLGFTVVRSKVIPDTRGTGISAAMVQLASREEAASAIATLDGEVFPPLDSLMSADHGGGSSPTGEGAGGVALRVKYAGGDGSRASDNLYISGLPSPAPDQATLHSILAGLGLTVVRSRIIPDTRGSGISAALVQLASQEEAAAAILALDGETFSAPAEALPSRPAAPAAPALPQGERGAVLRVKYAGGDGSQPSDNLYISGLPSPAPDQATLDQVFSGLGLTVVRSRVIQDTRGIGVSAALVQLASQQEAASAIASLNGEVFPPLDSLRPQDHGGTSAETMQASSGSTLRVKYAGGGASPSDNLYVSGLPSPAPEQAGLDWMFAGLGFTVVRSRVIPDTRGSGSSAALVQLGSPEEAAAAMSGLLNAC
uniref:RRM domain-containing protein n=1 Tax=Alexandrium monilatum TaxID=311494 RepID=A0A7S4SHH4_9DINO